jgi:thiamine transport system permease protein
MVTGVGAPIEKRKMRPALLFLPPLLFLTLFFLFPLVSLVSQSLVQESTFPLYKDELFWRIFLFTYGQAFLSAILSAGVGTLGAWVYSEYRFPGRRFFWQSNLLFFSLPTLIAVLALTSFWGKFGIGHFLPGFSLYGWFGILAGHVFFNAPLFVKWVGLALEERDREPERAAVMLGAGPLRTFWEITFPGIRPAFNSALAMAFVLSSSSFLIVMLLGGGPRFQTLELAVYESIKMNLNLPMAVQLASVQLFVSLVVYWFFLRHSFGPAATQRNLLMISESGWGLPVFFFLCYFFVCVGPILFWLASSWVGFSEVDWSVTLSSLWTSFFLASLVGSLSVFLSFLMAYGVRHSRLGLWRNIISLLMGVPVSLSGVVLSFAFLITWKEYLGREEIWAGLPILIVQTLLCLPFIYRVLHDGMERIDEPIYRAAMTLGASPWQVFRRVEFPLLSGAVLTAFLTAVGFSLGEIGTVLVFYSKQTQTLALRIEELMSVYRFSEAFAVGVILLFVMVLIFVGMERWKKV